MAAWCLPKKQASAFLDALTSGRLDPEKLRGLSSAERRGVLADIVGADHAANVNAQFEAKMLLKDQQRGLVTWAKNVAGLSDAARTDILAKIARMNRVLQPGDEREFLADLAARKLGVTVSATEARKIYELSEQAQAARARIVEGSTNSSTNGRIAYGLSLMDLTDYVDSLKPNVRSWGDITIDVLNIPKSALTSVLHLSAPFVQGWGMMTTARAWEAFGQMFRYFADEQNYRRLNAYIVSHPDYMLARDGKLGLTTLGDRLSQREEAIQSTLVEAANKYLSDKTGVPNLVRASSRAFTGYLNYVRFNRFADLLNAARLRGEDVCMGSSAVSDLAKVVNDFTGRGAIGKGDKYGQSAPALNVAFFSPRKISATMQMFEPTRYINPKISPTARIAAIRQLSGSLIATGAVLGLAKAMGASVDFDPRSSDFGKFGIGGEKFDITGGNAAYIRLLARLTTNEEITSHGKTIHFGEGYKPLTRADAVLQYIRNKFSPVAGAFTDALYGHDPVGRPFDVTEEMQDKLMPITMDAWWQFYRNNPGDTVAIVPALSAIFGVGLESPLPLRVESGRTIWGTPEGTYVNPHDPVNMELTRLGYTPSFPANTIRGVQLTPVQFDDYVRLSGKISKMRLDGLVAMPQWARLPDQARIALMKSAVRNGREAAQTAVMMQSQGTPNDILRAIVAAKYARVRSAVPAP